MTYRLTLDGHVVLKLEDDGSILSIPVNQDNVDYQQYQKWIDLGNEPEPAD